MVFYTMFHPLSFRATNITGCTKPRAHILAPRVLNVLNMEQSILEAIDYVRNVSKKRLSIVNILSRISKTTASNIDTRSLQKQLHQMIGKGLIDSSCKIVNKVNLKLNVETTSEDTHISNNDVEEVSSARQSILTDTPSNIHLSTEYMPIALEQLDTLSAIENNISVCNFKDQIMRLKAEIEALKSFFLGQIFAVKMSLEEKYQSAGDCNHVQSLKEEIKYPRAENEVKNAMIKTMSEKEKLLAQCSRSIIAPILESSKGNPKSNSPSKSDHSEV